MHSPSQPAAALAPYDTFILAGGLGLRLREAIGEKQKVAALVNGEHFVCRLLRQVAHFGGRRAVLGLGFRAADVRRPLGDEFAGVSLDYSMEEQPAGTGGALALAAPMLRSDHVLVMNGDSYVDADLSAFVDAALIQRSPISLLLARVPDCSSFGQVEQDTDGRITSFREKVGAHGPGWVNAGVYLFRRDALLALPRRLPLSLEKEVFPAWVGNGLHGVRTDGHFIDIGTPERLRLASDFFATIALEETP